MHKIDGVPFWGNLFELVLVGGVHLCAEGCGQDELSDAA